MSEEDVLISDKPDGLVLIAVLELMLMLSAFIAGWFIYESLRLVTLLGRWFHPY